MGGCCNNQFLAQVESENSPSLQMVDLMRDLEAIDKKL